LTPAHNHNQKRSAQPLRTHNTCSTVAVAAGSYATAAVHINRSKHDQSTCTALVHTMTCQRPLQPPTANARRNTALLLSNAAVTHTCTQRSGVHTHEQSTSKPSHAALRSHTAATARRGAETHTRQQQAILRHSTLLTALDTAPAMRTQHAHSTSRV
jgi:hypothetical protein